MDFEQSRAIRVANAPGKNRGVFSRKTIRPGTIFERVPVLILDESEVFSVTSQVLSDYVFKWDPGQFALALGYGSLYNHSFNPNADFTLGPDASITFTCVRKISPGEEITINYNGAPNNRSMLHFEVK